MSMKDALNRANPNDLADILRTIKLGDLIRSLRTFLYKKTPTTTPSNMIAAVDAIILPTDAKAAKIVRAYARAGGGTLGELTVDAPPMGAATAAGHVNCTQSGDISFANGDAWTSIDVVYEPLKGDSYVVTLPVAADTFAIPKALTDKGVITILSCVVNTGSTTGTFAVIAPSDAKPGATKQCNLKLAKDNVLFKATDAVTNATITFLVAPATDLDAQLEGSESPLI